MLINGINRTIYFEIIIRAINSALGYLFIILCIRYGGNLYEYVILSPAASLSSVVFDFGRVELASKHGMNNTQRLKYLIEIRLISVLSMLSIPLIGLFNFVSPHHLIALSLLMFGIVLVPIDSLIRFYILLKKSPINCYFFQFCWAALNIVIVIVFGSYSLPLSALLVILLITPWLLMEIFIVTNIFSGSLPIDHRFPIVTKRSRVQALLYKIAPIIIYSLGLGISFLFDSKITQILNRTIFFFFGFFQLRILGNSSVNYSPDILAICLAFGGFFTAIPLVFSQNLTYNYDNDSSMLPVYGAFTIFLSTIYAVFLLKYRKYIIKKLL